MVTELEWIKNLLTELGIDITDPTVVQSDNLGATLQASNQACNTKIKHVAMDLKFVRGKVEAGSVIVMHVLSKYQRANILTKALSPKLFLDQQSNLVSAHSQA